jgi:hypothetical protein
LQYQKLDAAAATFSAAKAAIITAASVAAASVAEKTKDCIEKKNL